MLVQRLTLAALLLIIGIAHADTPTTDPTPLLTYAASHQFPPAIAASEMYTAKQRLSQTQFSLTRDPPPETNCAQTLGAKRFSNLYDDLGSAYSNVGDNAKAIEAYSKAIACSPRADYLHEQLAAALLDIGRYDDARAEAQRQVALGRTTSFSLYALLAQLDFIQDRWQDAVAHARLAAVGAPDDEQASYWQCFLWLAQKRRGTQEPALVSRREPEAWPMPILDSLQGKISQAELTDAVAAEEDGHRRREILTEALFYTGEKYLVDNKPAEATKYFTAAANLQVTYFIEHHLATAELEKLRPR
jgi:lipoprotein NlpI